MELGKSGIEVAKKHYHLFHGNVTPEDLELEESDEHLPILFKEGGQLDEFAISLIDTIDGKGDDIDTLLRNVIQHWQLERLSAIDRNILRLGVAELLYYKDIPPKVSINEYIEVAKYFGDRESAGFVNGILDRVARDHPAKSSSPKK
jgi:transcription antitermination factor NusB